MKISEVLVLVAILAYTSATPVSEVSDVIYEGLIHKDGSEIIGEINSYEGLPSKEFSQIRNRRLTCDVVHFNRHGACAKQCRSKNHEDGICKSRICVCRD